MKLRLKHFAFTAAIAPAALWLSGIVAIAAQLIIFHYLIDQINPWIQIHWDVSIADACIIMLPLVFMSARRRRLVWIAIAASSVLCYANLWYCRAFYDLMPLDSMGMGANLQDRVIDGFIDQLRWRDLSLLAPVVFFGLIHFLLRGKRLQRPLTRRAKLTMAAASILLCCGSFALQAYRLYDANSDKFDYWHALTNYRSTYREAAYKYVQHFSGMGAVWYAAWQLKNEFIPETLSADERAEIEAFWAERRQRPSAASRFAHNRGKNLIFIVVESLSADLLDLEAGGIAVTPTLNSLARTDGALVARHMRPQVGHGRSADGLFMYNTGLLPLRRNAVAKSFPSADYPSLVKALGVKNAVEVAGDPTTFYNHSITNISYGYTGFISGGNGKWRRDSWIFARADSAIATLKQPFVATVITLTMHDPYKGITGKRTAISGDKRFVQSDLNYMEEAHLFDKRLAWFINQLKRRGLYDNSVIVIASDHEPRRTALGPDFFTDNILLMVVNSGASLVTDRIIGQIDVYPTILDLMGVTDYAYPGVGTSIVADTARHGLVNFDGCVVDEPADSTALHRAWDISALLIESSYF